MPGMPSPKGAMGCTPRTPSKGERFSSKVLRVQIHRVLFISTFLTSCKREEASLEVRLKQAKSGLYELIVAAREGRYFSALSPGRDKSEIQTSGPMSIPKVLAYSFVSSKK